MNPFKHAQTDSEVSQDTEFAGRVALVALLVTLTAGLGVVWWKARHHADAARGTARREALARTTALDAQWARALGAVRTLAGLAGQGGGAIPGFQKLGTDLLTAWPGAAWIDFEPNGIVSDIVPRAGHERALGVNVLRDRTQRAAAFPTISTPVTLDRGERGMVVRAPVIVRGRDGRETVSGFVAAGLRLQDLETLAGFGDLATGGYDYAFGWRDPAQPGKVVWLDSRGQISLPNAEPQLSRMPNTGGFFLTLQPRGGWVSESRIVFECLVVIAVSALIWLALHLLETGRAMERSLGDINQRLARATAERKQAQEALATAQDDLKRTRAAVQQVEARAEAATRTATESREHLQTKLKETEAEARALQSHLDDATRSLQAKQAQLEESQAALQGQASEHQAAVTDWQSRLNRAAEAAQEAARTGEAAKTKATEWEAAAAAREARIQEDGVKLASLQTQLEAATEAARAADRASEVARARAAEGEARNRELEARLIESAAATNPGSATLQTRIKEQDEAIAGLQSRLEAATASARDAADDIAAAVARLDQLEGRNQKLKARVIELEETEARLVEVTSQLETTRAQLARLSTPGASDTSSATAAGLMPARPDHPLTTAAEARTAPPPPADGQTPATPVDPSAAATDLRGPVAEAPIVTLTAPPVATNAMVPEPAAGLTFTTKSEPPHASFEPRLDPPTAAPVAVAAPPEDSPASRKLVKPGRPKKPRRDDHEMFDLFAAPVAEGGTDSVNRAVSFGPAFDEPTSPAGEEGPTGTEAPLDEGAEKQPRAPRGVLAVNPPLLRKAINQIMPLFAGEDPGAKDCLKDNRATFRAAFTPEGYAEFEQAVKTSDFAGAMEHLKKAARRHNLPI